MYENDAVALSCWLISQFSQIHILLCTTGWVEDFANHLKHLTTILTLTTQTEIESNWPKYHQIVQYNEDYPHPCNTKIFPPPHHYHGQHQLRSDLNIQNHWFCLTTSQILAFSKIDPLWRGHGHELLLSYISWQQSFTSINYPRKYLSLVREKIFFKFCVRSGQC